MSIEKTTPRTRERVPVHDAPESVSYLGVDLPKAANRENAPRREQFADYINDPFALELQKKIAISFRQGDPVLIEGGTSIGKTTTVRKMCADLGWEVHYVNLNGATDVEDLMGRYIPNHERKSSADPEYVFADGKVTSGLRQESGKVKVIVLDEFGAAAPNIAIRLHEVLDALERGGEVVLAEDASEKLPVDKAMTKVVALTNPPGRGYLQREPLDPAQIRRWVYLKEATELPDETLTHATRALFNLEQPTKDVPAERYLYANEATLSPAQLREIPGIDAILEKYLEFHRAAKELLKNRAIGGDQPQKFFFDDREEPKRVRDFIAMFYRGDINDTMQTALRYYYAGKLLNEEDKAQLEELIRHVEYVPAVASSKRVALEPERSPEAVSAPETAPGMASLEEAERILGKDVFGPKDIEAVFGTKIDRVPPIPFSRTELERAKALGQQLILFSDSMTVEERGGILRGSKKSAKALTLENFKAHFEKAHDGKPMLWSQDWYNGEDFFKNEKPRAGWRLVSKDVVPDSTSKNYLQQTDVLVEYLKTEVFKGMPMPKKFADAIAEFTRERSKIETLMADTKDPVAWKKASQALASLTITQLGRETPIEAVYRLALNSLARKDKPLTGRYTWTSRRASGGRLVFVGRFDGRGAYVNDGGPRVTTDFLGVCLSRN